MTRLLLTLSLTTLVCTTAPARSQQVAPSLAPPPSDTNPDGSWVIRQRESARDAARDKHIGIGALVGEVGGGVLTIHETVKCGRRSKDNTICGIRMVVELPAFVLAGAIAGAAIGALWPVSK